MKKLLAVILAFTLVTTCVITVTAKSEKADNTVAVTQSVSSQANSGGFFDLFTDLRRALFSYKYDAGGGYFYTEDNPIQRNFGYTPFYDWAAQFMVLLYDTVRVKFEYDGLGYMIQMWKGMYGWVFVGSELGLYCRNLSSDRIYFECPEDDQLLPMQMTLYQDGNLLFSRKLEPSWWQTGFVVGHLTDFDFADRSCLTMVASIQLESAQMAKLFADGLGKAGFTGVKEFPYSFPLGDGFATDAEDIYAISESDSRVVEFVWRNLDQGSSVDSLL